MTNEVIPENIMLDLKFALRYIIELDHIIIKKGVVQSPTIYSETVPILINPSSGNTSIPKYDDRYQSGII
jgi:hypothetical protein